MTIFRVLLNGDLEFSDKYLFYKRDHGTYLDANINLQNLNFNLLIIRRILRFFLIHPIFYLYDFIYSINELFKIKLTLKDKFIIGLYTFKFYIKSNLCYLKIVLIGSYFLIIGLGIKIYKLF